MVETERSEVLTGVAMGTRGGVVRCCSCFDATDALLTDTRVVLDHSIIVIVLHIRKSES